MFGNHLLLFSEPLLPFSKTWNVLWNFNLLEHKALTRVMISNHLLLFSEPLLPFSKTWNVLWNFNLLEIVSTTIKSMCSKILVCCLHSILCISIGEMPYNPFVPFSKVCKLLWDLTLLKHETLRRVMFSDHLLYWSLLAFLEVSKEPFCPSFIRSKLLFNLLKVESWSSKWGSDPAMAIVVVISSSLSSSKWS